MLISEISTISSWPKNFKCFKNWLDPYICIIILKNEDIILFYYYLGVFTDVWTQNIFLYILLSPYAMVGL